VFLKLFDLNKKKLNPKKQRGTVQLEPNIYVNLSIKRKLKVVHMSKLVFIFRKFSTVSYRAVSS